MSNHSDRRTSRGGFVGGVHFLAATGLLLFVLQPGARASAQTTAQDPLAILASIQRQQAAPEATLSRSVFSRSEYSLQLTGLLSKTSKGSLTAALAPDSVGFLFGMRFHLNPWEAFEFELGSTNNGALYSSGPTTSGSASVAYVSARMRRISVNEVVTASAASHLAPFLLAGGGVAEFQPTGAGSGSFRSEVRALGDVGAGVDIRFLHLGVRAEVEGLFYKTPDFHNPALSASWTHVAQPSAGLIFTF